MRTGLALVIFLSTTLAAFADGGGSVIVIPSRPGVPVVINGCDASFAVVEGDWGLDKNIHVQPTVYGGRPLYTRPVGHYYPSAGRRPGYGRYEVDTPQRNLPRAESYTRSWSAESQPTPHQDSVPFDPPPVVVAPQPRRQMPGHGNRDRRDRNHHHHNNNDAEWRHSR